MRKLKKLKSQKKLRLEVLERDIRSIFVGANVSADIGTELVIEKVSRIVEEYGDERFANGWDECARSEQR